VHNAILKDFPDADIAVSLIWIDMLPADDLAAAREIAKTIRDPRVRQYHDPRASHLAGTEFAKGLVKRGLAWDIYLFYDKDAVWEDTPPKPVEWWHQLGGGARADSDRFAGGVLHERLHESMHKVTGAKCRAE